MSTSKLVAWEKKHVANNLIKLDFGQASWSTEELI